MGTVERRARERKQRREDILDAAETVFRDRSFEKATMDEVAEACELAKGTLYRYFASKDDLYLGLAARGIRTLQSMLKDAVKDAVQGDGSSGLTAIQRAIGTYARFSRERPMYFDAFRFFNSAELAFDAPTESLSDCGVAYAEVLEHLHGLLAQGFADESLRRRDDPMLTVALLSMTTTGFLSMLHKREAYLRLAFGEHDFVERFSSLVGDALKKG